MLRKVTVIAAMLATTIALVACGGSSSPKQTNASSKTPDQSAGLKLAECMRSHGVSNFPDPSANGGGGTQIQQSSNGSSSSITVDGVHIDASAPTFQHAMNACQQDQPQGPALSASKQAAIQKDAVKMAECMRANGVPNFPDPKVSTGPNGHGVAISIGGKVSGGSGLDPSSPAFKAAQAKCMPLMSAAIGKPVKAGS